MHRARGTIINRVFRFMSELLRSLVRLLLWRIPSTVRVVSLLGRLESELPPRQRDRLYKEIAEVKVAEEILG
jgi:hypothetical protein